MDEVKNTHTQFSVSKTSELLLQTLALLEWIVPRVPIEWHHREPAGTVRGIKGDERTVAFHLAHLTLYENKLANPVLESLAEGGNGVATVPNGHVYWFLEDVKALSVEPLHDIVTQLRAARMRHLKIVSSFDDERFNVPLTPLWGTGDGTRLESAGWVANKTIQHTVEHANTLYRFVLFAPR